MDIQTTATNDTKAEYYFFFSFLGEKRSRKKNDHTEVFWAPLKVKKCMKNNKIKKNHIREPYKKTREQN